MDSPTLGALPGIGQATFTTENIVVWGRETDLKYGLAIITSGAVDAGNTPTTSLRPGLVLGQITSSGFLTAYSATASDGSQYVYGVLMYGVNMLGQSGSPEQRSQMVIVGGLVKASTLLGLDGNARRQMQTSGRFLFDDDISSKNAFLGLPVAEKIITATTYTLVAADNGSLITNVGATGGLVLTLPAVGTNGFCVEVLNCVAQTLEVSSAEGTNIVWDGNAGVSNLTFSTASHKIGGHLQFFNNAAGTLWYVRQLGPSGETVTAS